jgi:hypothetical protein
MPIPASGQATATSDDVARRQVWYERNFLEGYRRARRRNPKWDLQAEELIRLSAATLLEIGPGASLDVLGRARTLVASGCDDPMVLFLAARALSSADRESREASDLFERAFTGIHDAGYSRAVARMVASGLRQDLERRNEGMGRRQALDPVELRWFMESLRDGSYTADEDGVLADQLNLTDTGVSLFDRNRAAIAAALEGTDWVDSWVRLFFSGKRHMENAWDARGGAYASKVKQEEWKGFSESMALARTAFEAAWRARPDRPEAAGRMISVAMAEAQPGETPRLWFDRTVAARLDYMPAYDRLLNALRRRWSADAGALLAFAHECAATRRFDTDVPFVAFQAVERMERDLFDEARGDDEEPLAPHLRPASPYASDEVYTLVSTMLERYRREPARSFEWKRYVSLQAAVAYKAGRYELARQALRDAGGVLDETARSAVDEDVLEARIEAYAAPEGAETRRAERLWLEDRRQEAQPLFAKARASAPVEARPYLDKRLAVVGMEVDLAAGRSVRFLPGKDMPGWTVHNGKWSLEADGSLLATSGAKGLMLAADARVGPDFEVEAELEIAATSNGQFQAGLLFGRRLTFDSQDWSSFRLKRTAHEGEVVYFSRHFFKPPQPVKRKVAKRSRVVVQSWGGRLWAYVDGQAVIADYLPEWPMPRTADVQVGFGSYVDDNTYQVRYRGVRLRRLATAPTPPGRIQ